MSGFTMTEWVDAAPNTVFEETIGTKNVEAIMPAGSSMTQITDGEIGVGTRFSETRMMKGKPTTTELEVTGFERPTYYAMTNVMQGVTTTYHYWFSAEKTGTRITLEATVSAKGVRKLIVPIVVGVLKKEDGDHLAKLKSVIEARLAQPA